jgi:hypothetical protein
MDASPVKEGLVSETTQPQTRGLHSQATAAIGARLHVGARGRGSDYAQLVWLVILSHTPWPGRGERPTWASNVTLAAEAGLDEREVARALAVLREAGMLETPIGRRPGARRPFGRLLVPRIGAPVKLLIPERHDMANLWGLCRERRARPASLVTAAVGAYALASDHAGHRPRDWTQIGCRQADWRRFVGARKNASWTKRVRELEQLDIVRRRGRVIEVAPTRSWLRAARVLDLFVDATGPPLAA